MKKLNYLLLGLAGLAMASCSQDDGLGNPAEGYSITVNLPADMSTRAIGDNVTDLQLTYALYDSNKNLVTSNSKLSIKPGTPTSVSLPLVKGNSYTVAFFAQASGTSDVYAINASSGTMTVNYSEMTATSNADDTYDCFYNNYVISNVSSSLSATVELTRPVAQINWGTSDLDDTSVTNAFGDNMATTLNIAANNTLNLIDGSVSGATTAADICGPWLTSAYSGQTYPITSYDYLAMQYILAGKTSATYSVSLSVSGQEGNEQPILIEVDNVPLQANYRTNIYGALLTNSADLSVNITSSWDGENPIDLSTWDGTTKSYPTVTDPSTPVVISSASDLAGLADMIQGYTDESGVEHPANDFAGYTIALAADYDMGGKEFPMLGSATRSSGTTGEGTTPFRGTFDGQGHTISNVKIQGTTNSNDAAGFIPNLDGASATVKDITFSGLTINAPSNKQAGVVGLVTDGATVSGVTVTSGSVTAAEAPGGIVGRILVNGTVENCENHANISSNGQNGGGIVGSATYNSSEGCQMTIKNCKNYGTVTGNNTSIGGIVGTSAANVSACDNYGEVNCSSNTIGGVVAYQVMAGSVKNCNNYAEVTGGTFVGGVIGRVAYGLGATSYPYSEPIVVSGNTNSAVISGSTEIGGIIGRWSSADGSCINNSNTASTLIATGASNAYVAGIIANIDSGNITVNGNTSSTAIEDMTGVQKGLLYNGKVPAE